MATNFFNKAFSLVLAFFFAFQAIGVTVDVHYCKGELQSISFFGKAVPCTKANPENLRACCKKRLEKLADKKGFHKDGKCCSNEMFHLQLEDSFLDAQVTEWVGFDMINLQPVQQQLIRPVHNKKHLTPDTSDPPLPRQDLNIIYQVFRI